MTRLSILSLSLITLAIVSKISSEHCTQSSAVAPEKARFLFYSDNRKAQMLCQAGFHPENMQQSMLYCNQGKWVGTLSKCVPNSCRKSTLQSAKYWPTDGKFEFSPDPGSELMKHQTVATVVCDLDYYTARMNAADKKYYTTFEVETFTCHYGTWVGQRKTKCLLKPVSSRLNMFETYNTKNKDYTYVKWSQYAEITGANINKNGIKFAIMQSTNECPEKVPLYRLYRSPAADHMFTASKDKKNAMHGSNGWRYEFFSGYCVTKKGQCGMNGELHEYYNAGITAHLYRRNTGGVISGWKHNGITCYIY